MSKINSNKKLIAVPSRTTEIMRKYDIKMKKSLGQNFLIEPNILEKMIEAADITRETTVVEIGPGIGALTEFLALHAKEVTAFEIDERFVTILKETLADYSNVKVVHQDILKVDFEAEDYQSLREAEDLVVVANLPYYITTPIIMRLLESGLPFKRLAMMMQKEVAERMTAEVGTKAYNSLSIAIQNHMTSEIPFIVPKTVFIPKPNVDSAVLLLARRPQPLADVKDKEAFERFVQAAFKQRRKTIWNNLRHHFQEQLPLDKLEAAFETASIEKIRRAETLTIDEFERLYETINQIKK